MIFQSIFFLIVLLASLAFFFFALFQVLKGRWSWKDAMPILIVSGLFSVISFLGYVEGSHGLMPEVGIFEN